MWQVITNRDTQETLLCIAYVYEVSTSEHGAQHHIYRLVKDQHHLLGDVENFTKDIYFPAGSSSLVFPKTSGHRIQSLLSLSPILQPPIVYNALVSLSTPLIFKYFTTCLRVSVYQVEHIANCFCRDAVKQENIAQASGVDLAVKGAPPPPQIDTIGLKPRLACLPSGTLVAEPDGRADYSNCGTQKFSRPTVYFAVVARLALAAIQLSNVDL